MKYRRKQTIQVALISVKMNSLDQDSTIVALSLLSLAPSFVDLFFQKLLLALCRVGGQVFGSCFRLVLFMLARAVAMMFVFF